MKTMLAKLLVAGAILWPILMAATVLERVNGRQPLWTTIVYVAGSKICHQRPERSFRTAGVQWPVCARCSGLYASAPLGALLPVMLRRRWTRPLAVRLAAIAAVPTLLTIGIEWSGLADPGNIVRSAAALPLGMAIALLLVATAAEPAKSDRVH
jgi:uncharacterized membrane protein